MKENMTNFAYLMDLLNIPARQLWEAVGADKTLVSRWRSGARRLMPGHHWAEDIAGYFFEVDTKRKSPVLPDLLGAYYPGETADSPEEQKRLLAHWLTSAGQKQAEYHRQREGLLSALMEKMRMLSEPEPQEEDAMPVPVPPPLENTVVWGVPGVQGSALQVIDIVMEQEGPQEIWYVCPEGLDMYTRDERFGPLLMDRMMEMFAAGHTLNVILRTDYKMTDVSVFSGRWLVAHLLGYVKSHYFDEFHGSYDDKMLAVIRGRMAMKVTAAKAKDKNGEKGGVYTALYFDAHTVNAVWNEVESYKKRSRQRFHYEFFEKPGGFLRGHDPLRDRAHYQFARLPYFCLTSRERFQSDFALSEEEMTRIEADFAPLLIPPEFFEPETTVRHIFCEEDIEDALLKSRRVSQELSAVTGRRVYLPAQAVTDRLSLIKRLLLEHQNYEVCFLPDSVFQKLTMQIACWGDRAAIGWIAGGKSTACRDYTNVNALTGFCEAVWEKVPGVARQRRAALRKLDTWLKKAAKYGYTLDG